MALHHGEQDIQRVLDSIDRTEERAQDEGFTGPDDGLETLKEFCHTLLDGSGIDTFLSGQDMVIP